MSDRFVHLHVASGYSLRHGASHPAVLVRRAADHGMATLALTDRDGVYGAVKFVTACMAAGVRPVLGVDLAVAPDPSPERPRPGRRRSPARGGTEVDPRLPRVVLLATGATGWASLVRLISATHLAGERGVPVASRELVAAHARGLVLMLGHDSDVGRALGQRRPDLATAALEAWRGAMHATTGEPPDVVAEVVCHRGPGDRARAGRLLGWADDVGLPAILTNAVRGADHDDGPTLDVLDAARRLVPLDARHVDRVNAEAYLKSGAQMAEVAEEVADAAGRTGRGGADLLAATRRLAERCVLDPQADLGIGSVHFPDLAVGGDDPDTVLRARCEAGYARRGIAVTPARSDRLDTELAVIRTLGFPTYFLTVADVVDLVRSMGVRVAARGSGVGSIVNYLLGIADIDPLDHRLLMERFLSVTRDQLPDVDLDVESARRTEVYERILEVFGGQRCACVSMMDTYRARHAIRDVGAALGLPLGEIDTLAKAFPHIRAGQVRAALVDLPELRASGIARTAGPARLDLLFRLVERLDGLPRHVALHPCGVLLSDTTLLDRTPVEASYLGFPMSQFDKDDVETLGLLKLDVLGIRMQSAIAHAIEEVRRVDGEAVDVDTIPRDDPATFELIRSTRTLGCFQIESPGQRELVGKFGPESFDDIIIDISLFRPGPVKSDMIRPFLEVRHGWAPATYLHEDLRDALESTCGVVVFHEQVLEIFSVLTGCTLADADEARRGLGDPVAQPQVQDWFIPTALGRGYSLQVVEQAWEILSSFGSFGFCKAHAAAFALPTYQSAWLKAHYTAAFVAGVLTHDPGMYPKRLILDDARQFGIAILGLDVNVSDGSYRLEALDRTQGHRSSPAPCLPLEDPAPGHYGIRLSLADVKGIADAEIARIVAGRPYSSLSDFWHRAAVSRPVVERLVLAGGFDAIYGIGATLPVRRRGQLTRRDLLLQAAELDTYTRAAARSARKLSAPRRAMALPGADNSTRFRVATDTVGQARRQSQAAAAVRPVEMQLAFDLGGGPADPIDGGATSSGLAELSPAEQVRAELEVLGLDASRHVMAAYEPLLAALGVTRARDLLGCRNRAEILVAGVKVATQTPPIRSGRRVVFVTLDDATGPLDATLFEDAQAGYATTVFHSWLLVIRGTLRRTGPRGVSINASGAWELPAMYDAWRTGGTAAVAQLMLASAVVTDAAVQGAAASRSTRPVTARPPVVGGGAVRGLTGVRSSPYADIRPAGGDPSTAPRKLWHSSPGSSGG